MLESLNSTILGLPWASFNNHAMEAKQVTLFSYLKQNEDQGYWEGNLITCAHNFIQGKRENNTLLTYFWVWVFPAGILGAVQILNSIEESLEDVLLSVVSSDNNTVAPDSTNSSMVVVDMASLALPDWPPQKLCCWYKDYVCVGKTYS